MLRGPFVPSNFTAIVVVGMVGVLKALMVDAGMIGRIVKSLGPDPGSSGGGGRASSLHWPVALRRRCRDVLLHGGRGVRGHGADPQQKAAANYWHRHLIEHIVPVYPAYVMASQLSGTPVRHMMMLTLAGAVVHALSAVPIVFRARACRRSRRARQHRLRPGARAEKTREPGQSHVEHGADHGTVILVVFFEWHIGIALGLAIAAVLVYRNPGWRRFWQIAKDSFVGRPALMLVGIMVFGRCS